MTPEVLVYPDRSALIEAALALIVERILTAINERQSCTIALSGGSTPQPLYAALAGADLPWQQIQIFWGDERYVPATDPDSNYGMTKRVWLDLVPIPAANIHPMPTGLAQPQLAAEDYDRQIVAHFGSEAGSIPVFDIILLGMGDDGHTASLFPHTAALSVRDRLVTLGDKDGQRNFLTHRRSHRLSIPRCSTARRVIVAVRCCCWREIKIRAGRLVPSQRQIGYLG